MPLLFASSFLDFHCSEDNNSSTYGSAGDLWLGAPWRTCCRDTRPLLIVLMLRLRAVTAATWIIATSPMAVRCNCSIAWRKNSRLQTPLSVFCWGFLSMSLHGEGISGPALGGTWTISATVFFCRMLQVAAYRERAALSNRNLSTGTDSSDACRLLWPRYKLFLHRFQSAHEPLYLRNFTSAIFF